ncbi:hypothetical protein SDC9_191202 [bioreactor metagenome]|uniref:Uncharacterized protein n=1 Tax=bioreactor metagenome TaxID=1076179 RepID=A0A645HYS9_9ZZZZ
MGKYKIARDRAARARADDQRRIELFTRRNIIHDNGRTKIEQHGAQIAFIHQYADRRHGEHAERPEFPHARFFAQPARQHDHPRHLNKL